LQTNNGQHRDLASNKQGSEASTADNSACLVPTRGLSRKIKELVSQLNEQGRVVGEGLLAVVAPADDAISVDDEGAVELDDAQHQWLGCFVELLASAAQCGYARFDIRRHPLQRKPPSSIEIGACDGILPACS
jgi:hypothetical protein